MASSSNKYTYEVVPDVEHSVDSVGKVDEKEDDEKSSLTYNLSFPFQLMSGTVWCSMSIWGVWIAIFYGKAALFDWTLFNTVDYDMYQPKEAPWATFAICFHLVGAAYMAIAGAFQLVKYIRKKYPAYHRWVGRFYILATLIATGGALFFIFAKGGYGGRAADSSFATYGIIFMYAGLATYYYARRKDYVMHKLWAWRLYSLSLSGWLYRFDYYWWMVFFGVGDSSWMHTSDFQGWIDFILNWAFFVPSLIVVEIVFRWGENKELPSFWTRVLNVCYYIIFVMTAIFTIHGLIQLRVPTIMGSYKDGWIM